MGGARDIKKKKFQNSTKNGNKVWTILKSWNVVQGPNFANCPNFVTIFCRVLKMKIIFFDIPSYPPPIAVQNSLTNQFFQKKLTILYIFKTKKVQNWREKKGHFSFLNCPNFVTIFCRVLKMTNNFFQKN